MNPALARPVLQMLSPAGRRARLMIFAFHRVLEDRDALLTGEPDAAAFRRALECIASLCRVLPLADAVEALRRGRLPARAASITFDDGYRNNLTVAKPLLKAVGLPATVFVAADAVRDGIMWNDLVIEAARSGVQDVELRDIGLPDFCASEGRFAQAEHVIDEIKYAPPPTRWAKSVEVYRRIVGRTPPRLMLTESELTELEGDGIDLGAHTMSHPILTRISDDAARNEIVDSRRWLADRIGTAPRLFAYPNGQPRTDYDERHVRMVREAGFSAAVSTSWAAATAQSSLYELPRFTPWERDAGAFAARLVKVCARSYLPRA